MDSVRKTEECTNIYCGSWCSYVHAWLIGIATVIESQELVSKLDIPGMAGTTGIAGSCCARVRC